MTGADQPHVYTASSHEHGFCDVCSLADDDDRANHLPEATKAVTGADQTDAAEAVRSHMPLHIWNGGLLRACECDCGRAHEDISGDWTDAIRWRDGAFRTHLNEAFAAEVARRVDEVVAAWSATADATVREAERQSADAYAAGADEALRRAHAAIDDEAETVHEALVVLEQMREEVRRG